MQCQVLQGVTFAAYFHAHAVANLYAQHVAGVCNAELGGAVVELDRLQIHRNAVAQVDGRLPDALFTDPPIWPQFAPAVWPGLTGIAPAGQRWRGGRRLR